VIMTPHDLTLASQADRLILLGSAGEIMANGGADAVLRELAEWHAYRFENGRLCVSAALSR